MVQGSVGGPYSAETLKTMVSTAGVDGPVTTIQAVEEGVSEVYRLTVEQAATDASYYLKAAPEEEWGIPTEARVQAVLATQTSLPVASIVGVVDEHDRVPAPYFLMTAQPGTARPYEAVTEFSDQTLDRFAETMGRYLGMVHSCTEFAAFGHLTHQDRVRRGSAPTGDPRALAVDSEIDTWAAYFHRRVEIAYERLAESQFTDERARLRPWLDQLEFETPRTPVLGRNDHGLHNVLLSEETTITALLDWGYTLAVPAAYDMAFAAYIYSGAFFRGRADVCDRRELVWKALNRGYHTQRGVTLPRVPAYEALAVMRVMADFSHLTIPAGEETAVAAGLRSTITELLAEPPRGAEETAR